MKIILVGMINSIHLARWIEHLHTYRKFKIYVFPIFPTKIHPKLLNISDIKKNNKNIKIIKIFPWFIIDIYLFKFCKFFFKDFFLLKWFNYNISKLNPKYVHSHELTTSAMLCLKSKLKLKNNFPKWIVTNWGSELYFFYKKKYFKQTLRKILKLSDFYSAECKRDFFLAKKIGTNAKFLDCILNSGGINLKKTAKLSNKILTSSRKIILIKGYHGLFGLSLNAIKAVEKIYKSLKNYKVVIYSSDDIVIEYCKKLHKKINIEIHSTKYSLSENYMYNLFAKSKVYIGLSKSDGISTSLLEAMALRVFPIQSNTSCANEWILNNKTGFIVNPYDINIIKNKILYALKNDSFINTATSINKKIIKEKASSLIIKDKIRNIYK